MNLEPCALDRRRFFQASTAAIAGTSCSASVLAADFPRSRPPARPDKPAKKLAIITTVYYYLSHSYHIGGRFLNGYLRQGRMHYPDFGVASMYVEQKGKSDLSEQHAKTHGFSVFGSISDALTLGGKQLAVDGVLLIAEHGDYPVNAKSQILYPRYEMFQKIVEVFRQSGRSVPVFCDKHLSFDRGKAKSMVETARKVGFPMFAGSSLPVTWRRPELELPLNSPIQEALVAAAGGVEVYGIHALEALQCMVERRVKGEQGVKAVTCLEGDAVWKAGDDGLWSWELLEHALARSPSLNVGDIRENCRHFVPRSRMEMPRGPAAFVIEYRDGLKATVLLLNGHVDDATFAARIKGEKKPVSTLFYLPPPPGAAFLEALTVKIEEFLAAGKPPYPVERTQLTGGILDMVLESRAREHKRLETPDLDISYEPPKDSGFLRGEYTKAIGP